MPNRRCSIDGCNKPHKAHGCCAMHDNRIKRHGSPHVVKKPTPMTGQRNGRYSHGGHGTRLWNIWSGMKGRCLNPNTDAFKNYGGRGIRLCDRWMAFTAFRDDMGESYFEGATIERRDVDGDYCPENCCWIPRAEQPRNSRRKRLVEYRGQTKPVFVWAEQLGIPYHKLYKRLFCYHMPVEKAFLADLLLKTA